MRPDQADALAQVRAAFERRETVSLRRDMTLRRAIERPAKTRCDA